MFCAPIVLCLLNCIVETIQVTTGQKYSLVASPAAKGTIGRSRSTDLYCFLLV
jgi:hypothetical protein